MPRLFADPSPPPDTRPAMMSVVALMLILLPMLLMTTSVQKLTGLPLGVPGPTEQLPPEPPGAIERLQVERVTNGYVITTHVRSTDLGASAGDTEQKRFEAADLLGLQSVLGTLKAIDPKRERITLLPAANTTTDEVVRWMDAVRAGPDGALFPRVILATAGQ